MLTRGLFRATATAGMFAKQFSGTAAPAYCFASNQRFSDRLASIRRKNPSAYNIPSDSTLKDVMNNEGLNSFIQRVYTTTGVSVLGALATAQWAAMSGFAWYHPGACVLGGLVMSIGGIVATGRIAPDYVSVLKNGKQILKTVNSPLRLATYGLIIGGIGLSAAPLFLKMAMVNKAILPTSIVISSAIFGSASLYAYMKPRDSLLSWGSSLYAGLIGLIGLNLAGLLTHMVMGPNLFSYMMHRADTYIGLGLFTAMVAYDTHVAIKSYETGYADHLMVSIDFVLDFWNILMRVMQILNQFSGND